MPATSPPPTCIRRSRVSPPAAFRCSPPRRITTPRARFTARRLAWSRESSSRHRRSIVLFRTVSVTAIAIGTAQYPTVTAAQYNVDVAMQQVKVAEVGACARPCRCRATSQQNNESSLATLSSFSASVLGQITVPIYQGGAEYSLIRQAKETPGAAAPQSRLSPAIRRASASCSSGRRPNCRKAQPGNGDEPGEGYRVRAQRR